MSETAQRRDISDPETIADFAAHVGSQSRLRLLYVLTVCDIRSVGPGVWNDWKGTLLKSLFMTTRDYLDGHDDLDRPSRAMSLREQLLERLPLEMSKSVAPFLDRLGTNYWISFEMADFARHARFVDKVAGGTDAIVEAVHTRVNRPHDATELWILCADRKSLFADVARVIASCGASVTGARLHTGPVGADGKAQVLNVFYLQNADYKAFGSRNENSRLMLKKRTEAVLRENAEIPSIPTPLGSRRADAIPVKPFVRFSDTASGSTMIIEVQGRDRPGLLSAIAAVLRDHDLEVLSAHVEGVGEKAVDAFYVRQQGGIGKVPDRIRRRVRAALRAVLVDASEMAG